MFLNQMEKSAKEIENEYEAMISKYDLETNAKQIAVAELKKYENIVFLDCRLPFEYETSTIPTSLLLTPSFGKKIESPVELPSDVRKAIESERTDLVVCFCTAGLRSGHVCVHLQNRYKEKKFMNLHGGIISYVNSGGVVVNAERKTTNRVHTFGKKWGKFLDAKKGKVVVGGPGISSSSASFFERIQLFIGSWFT
eukprot:g6500.t1